MSPDSQHVYVRTHIGLAVLDRTAAGGAIVQKPTFAGCFSEGNVANCTDVDGLAGNGYTMAVSPDGAHVYIAFDSPGGVAIFRRSPDGTLARPRVPRAVASAPTVPAAGRVGAAWTATMGSATTYTLAISPDGRSVYAAGVNGVTSFARDGTTGNLVQTGCNGPVSGCAPVAAGVSSVFDLAVTPDGGEVIAGAHGSESVISFHRDPATGALASRAGTRGCLTRTGNARPLPHAPAARRRSPRPAGDGSRPGCGSTSPAAPGCSRRSRATSRRNASRPPWTPPSTRWWRSRSPAADANGDRFTVEKVGLPAAGQLGEIVNNDSVFYSPFANFTGSDSFTIRAKSPDRGVDGPSATVNVTVAGPVAAHPIVNPSGVDGDRDGFFAGQDCNDANAAIRPGAQEIKGNRTDENCDGTAEPFPTLASGVVSKWDVKGSRLTLRRCRSRSSSRAAGRRGSTAAASRSARSRPSR